MKAHVIPFKISPLMTAYKVSEEMYCDKKKCCKKFKKGKRCKKCPGRLKMA